MLKDSRKELKDVRQILTQTKNIPATSNVKTATGKNLTLRDNGKNDKVTNKMTPATQTLMTFSRLDEQLAKEKDQSSPLAVVEEVAVTPSTSSVAADENIGEQGLWNTVERQRKRRQRNIITGSRQNCTTLKGAVPTRDIYVGRCD